MKLVTVLVGSYLNKHSGINICLQRPLEHLFTLRIVSAVLDVWNEGISLQSEITTNNIKYV